MKPTSQHIKLLLGAIAIALVSCSKYIAEEQETCSVRLSVEKNSSSAAAGISYALLSASSADSSYVLRNEKIDLFAEADNYISEAIELPAGFYTINSFSLQTHDDKLVMLAPKPNSAASFRTGNSLPGELVFSAGKDLVFDIKIYSPKELGLRPADFGYSEFNEFEKPDLPERPDYKEHCVQIGVPADLKLLDTILFDVKVDGQLVLSGKCSQSNSSFMLPIAKDSVVVRTHSTKDFEIQSQTISADLISKYSCESGDFVNLIKAKHPASGSKICFIKQIQKDNNMAEIVLIDSHGDVYRAQSNQPIIDLDNDGIIPLFNGQYHYLQSLLVDRIGVVDVDSLNTFYNKAFGIVELDPDLSSDYQDENTPELYAVLYHGNSCQAVRLNANKYSGSQDTDVFKTVLHWLYRVRFRKALIGSSG